MPERICSITDCGHPHLARGWCHTHYQRWRKHGDPEHPVRPDKITGTCAVDGCETPRKIREWCRPHYLRWKRHGDPLAGYRSPGAPLPPCSVDGCTRPTARIIRGMCEMHHTRWKLTGSPGTAGSLRIVGDDVARFWSYVDKDGPIPERRPDLGPCWVWTGALNGDGYGSFNVAGGVGAHRWAYLTFVGPIEDGHEADHLCFNRACVNYERHLEPVTHLENTQRIRR